MSAGISKMVRDFTKTMKQSNNIKTSPYDTQAEVQRIEGDIAWVHIPGGVDVTPVKLTLNATKGDIVQVRVSGGSAWLTGNLSAPPTDDTKANIADGKATTAKVEAGVAKETAVVADTKATDAKETAEAILIYDHTYEIKEVEGVLSAVFHAQVYQGGIDIHEQFNPDWFTWYLKNESSEQPEYLGAGYTITVALSECGYGSEVIGQLDLNDDSELLTHDSSNLTNQNGSNYSVRASGDSVRVTDLQVKTSVYGVEKLMVVGVSDEHLITLDTLYSYIKNRLEDEVIYCGSSTDLVG